MSRSNRLIDAIGVVAMMLLALAQGGAFAAADDLVAQGRRIYREGILPSGKPLAGLRFGNVRVTGEEAACVRCHRRSGMGAVEGDVLVAPITGRYLFDPPDKSQLATMDPRRSKSFNMSHAPYDEATLARAVRTGISVGGRSMNDMMPRYALDEASFRALSAYLHQLTVDWSPGVDERTIRLATIVAPDADPVRRQAMVDMLRTAVLQKNANTVVGRQSGGRRHMVSAAEMVLGTERKWDLDVWQLEGSPDTWQTQLEAFYRKAPVFAVLSGIAGETWEPVHQFCEAQQLPCWFPVVDLPPVKTDDFYSVYFSRGVLLEADVLARHVRQMGPAPGRLVQVHRDDAAGRAAAAETAKALADSGVRVEVRALSSGDADALTKTLGDLAPSDAVMFWLRRDDIARLAGVTPSAGTAYFSGQMLAGERGVPMAWKKQARIVYPYELPQKRALSLSYFHHWLRHKRLPLVDEAMQSKVFFAANFMTDTLVEMLENLHRDYLLERAENMIGRREGSKAESEAQSRQMQRRAARAVVAAQRGEAGSDQEPEMIGERQSTTVFPRMSLAPGQRFASKGAYIVKFADTHSDTIVAETDWIVP